MAETPNLKITLLESSQAQKEITVNEAFHRVDALLNSAILDRGVNTPPANPNEGDSYIVGAAPTGAWAGKAHQVAYFQQIWRFILPKSGLMVWVADESLHYIFNGTVWDAVVVSSDMTRAVYDPANINQQLVGVSASQTLTNKTIILRQSASPTPTQEGAIEWDSDDDRIVVGDGVGQKIFRPVHTGTILRTMPMAFNSGTNSTSTTYVNAASSDFSYTPISTNSIIRIEMEASCTIGNLSATNTFMYMRLHEVTGTAVAIGQEATHGVANGAGNNALSVRVKLTAEVTNSALTARSFNWRHRSSHNTISATTNLITCIFTEIAA